MEREGSGQVINAEERKTDRIESLDLLRLVSIFFVVCIHYVGWGGVANANGVPMINFAISGGVAVACNCAVNCFYMITGYFCGGGNLQQEHKLFDRAKRSIKKVWVPTFLYSVLIPLLLMVTGNITLSAKQTVMLFLPILGNQYWFATCYIALMALSPFIAPALCRMDDKTLMRLVAVLILLDCIQPILGYNAFSNIGYGLLHAVTMYVIGYAIKRKDVHLKSLWCVLSFVLCVALIGLITVLSIKLTGDRNRNIADYNSILMVIQSVSFFLLFQNIKITKIRFSRLAPYVFGVYLLNDNAYARKFLWQNIFHCNEFYSNRLLIVHFLVCTVGFVVIAMLIEFVRINIGKQILTRMKGIKHG